MSHLNDLTKLQLIQRIVYLEKKLGELGVTEVPQSNVAEFFRKAKEAGHDSLHVSYDPEALIALALLKEGGSQVDPDSITYQRGVADGRRRHPPAEVTCTYLYGYKEGLQKEPEGGVTRIPKRDDDR